MKFNDFRFYVCKDWMFIIPTIVIQGKDVRYIDDNFSIEIHWLIWHMRWRWMEGEKK